MNDLSSGRRRLYWILIAIAVGMAVGRILSAQRMYEPAASREEGKAGDRRSAWPAKRPRPMATFSSNDRSRWATVRSLVDEGTYVIGRRDRTPAYISAASLLLASPLETAALAQLGYQARIARDSGIIFEDGWQSVDKVLHPQKFEFYSSKPPLLSTLLAGFYWLLKLLTGWTLADQPNEVFRTLLLVVNALPLFLYLVLFARLVDRFGTTEWGRMLVFAAGCFATLVNPFLNTLNNHLLGTFCVLFTLYLVVRIGDAMKEGGKAPVPWFFLAGLLAAFAVANELPALSFACAIGGLLLWWDPVRTLLGFAPGALIVLAGFLGTNYLAVGQLRPAYSEFGGPWYEYEGSHWRKPEPGQIRHGIDFAWTRESRATYAFHLLLGHHGLFSLTPLWLLAAAGLFLGRRNWREPLGLSEGQGGLPGFWQPLTLLLFVVVVGFYLVKSDNYGGWSIGPRWLIWLTPLFLVSLLPLADRLSFSRWGRFLVYVLLFLSAISANYPGWNPWRMPWIYDGMEWMGWIDY